MSGTVNDEELAKQIGSICVSGKMLTGSALVSYLNTMPPADKKSMLDDLALLGAWAMLERTVPDAPNAPDYRPVAK